VDEEEEVETLNQLRGLAGGLAGGSGVVVGEIAILSEGESISIGSILMSSTGVFLLENGGDMVMEAERDGGEMEMESTECEKKVELVGVESSSEGPLEETKGLLFTKMPRPFKPGRTSRLRSMEMMELLPERGLPIKSTLMGSALGRLLLLLG